MYAYVERGRIPLPRPILGSMGGMEFLHFGEVELDLLDSGGVPVLISHGPVLPFTDI